MCFPFHSFCGTKPQRARRVQTVNMATAKAIKYIWAREKWKKLLKLLFCCMKTARVLSCERTRVWHNQTANRKTLEMIPFLSAKPEAHFSTQGNERTRLISINFGFVLLCFKSIWIKKKLIRNMASGGLMFSFCAKFCVCLSHARTASGFSQFNQQNRNRNAKNPPILIDPRGIYVAENECETTAGCMICLLNIPCSIRNIAKNKTLRILVCLSTWERAQGENGSRLKKNN